MWTWQWGASLLGHLLTQVCGLGTRPLIAQRDLSEAIIATEQSYSRCIGRFPFLTFHPLTWGSDWLASAQWNWSPNWVACPGAGCLLDHLQKIAVSTLHTCLSPPRPLPCCACCPPPLLSCTDVSHIPSISSSELGATKKWFVLHHPIRYSVQGNQTNNCSTQFIVNLPRVFSQMWLGQLLCPVQIPDMTCCF